jgi:hypothetical protein
MRSAVFFAPTFGVDEQKNRAAAVTQIEVLPPKASAFNL